MYVEGVRMAVKPVILADDHPAILPVGPDSVSGIEGHYSAMTESRLRRVSVH